MKKSFWACIAIAILQFATVIFFYNKLPELIPTQWGFDGQINDYGSRNTVFIFPALSLVFTCILFFVPKLDPKGENIKKSGNAYPVTVIAVNLFMAGALALVLSMVFEYNVNIDKILPAAIGVLFIVLGIYLPKIKPNYMFGIRMPWTLASENVWVKTHKVGGPVFMIMGALFIVCALFPVPYNFIIPFIGLFAGLIYLCVYSYREFKAESK